MPINELTQVVITLHETVVIVNPVVGVMTNLKTSMCHQVMLHQVATITRLLNDQFTKSDDLAKPNILQSASFLFKSASIEVLNQWNEKEISLFPSYDYVLTTDASKSESGTGATLKKGKKITKTVLNQCEISDLTS
ncbi:hypothetical protein ACTFIR_003874 [Dictyostelium discoideum]